MAAQFDPILFSDWDAIQTIIYEQLGPLQEFAGSPGVYVEGIGYGLAQNQLQSRDYPFTRNIESISSEAQASVTFTSDHHLVVDEVIFFTNFNNSWGGLGIQNNFAKVVTVVDVNRVIVDFNTFGYTPWQIGDTAEAVQYYISANQFANLRADLAKVVKHITGALPQSGNNFPDGTSSELPLPIRGDVIYHSVYDPYYNVSTAANVHKFINNESAQFDYSMPSTATSTGDWNGITSYKFKITWPNTDGYDYIQFFNTGGLIKMDMLDVAASDPGNTISGATNGNRALNDAWVDFLTDNFPLYFGAKGKTQLGLASDPRAITSTGAYDLTGAYAEIYSATYGTNPYNASYEDHTIAVDAKFNVEQRDIEFEITLTDTSTTNSFANKVDIDRKLQVSFIYSTGSVPLAANPNTYILQSVGGSWS